MYKLIAIDMDGTLLKDNKTISNENLKAIMEASEHGIKVSLATGRPIKGIENYLKQLNLISDSNYAVGFNGAVVENTKSHQIISEDLLSLDDIKFINKLNKRSDVYTQLALKDSSVSPVRNKYSELDARLNDITFKVDNLKNVSENEHIFKLMFLGEEPALSQCISELPKEVYDKYTIVRSEPEILEFINKNTNKGHGVDVLAKKFGIDKSEVICIGDSFNDVHMLKYAGLGVAMGNAASEVKKIANYVTKTNEENGVAHVINKFVLSSILN